MNISPISSGPLSANLINLLSPNSALSLDVEKPSLTGQNELSFANVLTESLGTAAQADAIDKSSALELLMGQSDDLSGLLLDAQKAEMSLSLALQIRNKVMDAYNEVMRMQV